MAQHYIIQLAGSIEELMVEVNNRIDEHYVPIGGVCCDRNEDFFQAMVREISDPKIPARIEHAAWVALEEDLNEDDE